MSREPLIGETAYSLIADRQQPVEQLLAVGIVLRRKRQLSKMDRWVRSAVLEFELDPASLVRLADMDLKPADEELDARRRVSAVGKYLQNPAVQRREPRPGSL